MARSPLQKPIRALTPSATFPISRIIEAGFTPLGTNADTGLVEYRHVATGIDFVYFPGGTFEMGSPDTEPNRGDDEGPVHEVMLDPFLIGKTEVTQAQYEAVMGSNPSAFTGGDQRPIEQVSWNDLHAEDGFLARTGLGLPLEAQWEYAARGGTTTVFSFGDECNLSNCDPCATADSFIWWCANAGDMTQPVAQKEPNPFGLFDMHGSVFEWCEDVYDQFFYLKDDLNNLNPVATSGSNTHVIRGGAWSFGASSARSAARAGNDPDTRNPGRGFRVALTAP